MGRPVIRNPGRQDLPTNIRNTEIYDVCIVMIRSSRDAHSPAVTAKVSDLESIYTVASDPAEVGLDDAIFVFEWIGVADLKPANAP